VILREARPGDGRRLEEIRIAGWRAAYRGIVHPDLLRDLALDPERVTRRESWLAEPPAGQVTLVAEVDGVIAAGAFLWPARDEDLDPDGHAELATLYVDPAYWRRGLGSALLEEGFARMPQPVEVLWTFEQNAPARRFYERHGFAPDGARKPLPILGEPVEVRYRRPRRPQD
jgi:ribosomal protein S18 acetylase RimI-like enzyme